MAQIPSSRKKTRLIFLCFFLVAEIISGAALTTPGNTSNVTNYLNVSTTQPMSKDLVGVIPSIINKLGHLTSASMQQLDTALRWPTETLKETINATEESSTSSPLIEYPQSFQTTVMQINQQFTKALRAINSNADRMAMQLISGHSTIDTLNRYLGQYTEKANLIDKLIKLPLNGLKELSEQITVLSRENAFELQGVANLTNAFAETTKTVLSAKLEYLRNISNGSSFSQDLATKGNLKDTLERDIITLENTHQQWETKVKELENKFYKTLDTELAKLQKDDNPSCIKSRIQNWKDNIKDRLNVNECSKGNWTQLEKETVKSASKVRKQWELHMNETKKTVDTLIYKKEEHHNLSISIQKLEHTQKRLDQDISLLVKTKTSIEQPGLHLTNLVVGWNNLASYCLNIQSSVAEVRTTLLPRVTTDESMISIPSTEKLNEVNKQLNKIREDMTVVSKIAKSYVKAYESNLSTLASQLDQMMTISDESPTILEKNLIKASTNASQHIDEMQENTTTAQPLPQPYVD